MGLIPALGRSPGAGNGNPLQCLENPHLQCCRKHPLQPAASSLLSSAIITNEMWIDGSAGKESACNAGDTGDVSAGSIPGLGKSLEEEMATHSSILAWRIPWTEQSGGLQSMELKKSHTI